MTKRITSLFLALIMLITCSAVATISYAAEYDSEIMNCEFITIDGIEYKFFDTYTNDGKLMSHIINLNDNTEDIIYYDKEKGIVFQNDKAVAYVENVFDNAINNSPFALFSLASSGWRFHDTSTTRITWAMGTAVSTVAGAIASVIPGETTAQIILKMGLGAIKNLANSCIGATIRCDAYTQVLMDGKVQFRFIWNFTASSGDKYGPYTSYQL